jgi:flavin reductase (DIM6/NTAB) family NADH-FMN oxidoreductase RutF
MHSLALDIDPALPGNPTVARDTFREVLSRLATAVNVITTNGPAGRCGVTASAVCSVSDAPPTILVCLNRACRMNRSAKANGVFCVNILGADQRGLAEMFSGVGGIEMEQRFAHCCIVPTRSRAPVLADGLAALECDIAEIREVGTHSVIFGTVRAVQIGRTVSPLVYFQRGYHVVTDLSPERRRV